MRQSFKILFYKMSEIECRCDVSVNELSMSLHVTEIDEVGVTRPSDIHFASTIVRPVPPGLLLSNGTIRT